MKKLLVAAAVAAFSFAAPASAALLEFDLSAFVLSDEPNNTCCHGVSGGFLFDTDTQTLSNVAAQSLYETYSFGSFDLGFQAFGLFSNNSELVLDFTIDYSNLLAQVASASVGETLLASLFDVLVFDNTNFDIFEANVDSSLFVTVLDNSVTPPVPLPSGLPLMLGALGALGFAYRRRRT